MSLKKRLEVSSNRLNNFNRALKRWNDAEPTRLVFEDYVEGYAVIHVHCVFRGPKYEARDLCAVIEFEKTSVPVENDPAILDSLCADPATVQDTDSGQEELMLIDIVKVMKEHERILVPAPRVIERLQMLQHCQCALPDPTIQIVSSALEGTSIFQDWEVERGGVSGNPEGLFFVTSAQKI